MGFPYRVVFIGGLMLTAPQASAGAWSGTYLGLFAGYADASDAWDVLASPDEPVLSPEGASFGGFLGYAADLQGFVLGLEADLNFPDLNENAECTALIECTLDVELLTSLRARGGVALGNVLFYGTAGLAAGYLQAESTDLGGSSSGESFAGWTAGGGIEYRIALVRFGFEYRHSDYDDNAVSLGAASGNVGLETEEFRARIALELF